MKRLFKKYFHSVLDPQEFSRIEGFLINRKNDREITRLMRAHWQETMEEPHPGAKSDTELFDRIKKVNQAEKQKHIKRKLNFYTWGLRAAAVLLIALVSGSIFYMRSEKEQLSRQWHTIATPYGAKSWIILPDSTSIWLNAGSSIRYSNEFGIKKREVHLSGEAFFDVFRNPEALFLVKTSELTIKSYGTAFNVKSYPDEGTIETTLIEGSIGVTRTTFDARNRDEVLLEPNQRVVYYRKTKTLESQEPNEAIQDPTAPTGSGPSKQKTTYLISKGIDTKEYTSWKDGTIFIAGETLEELAIKLERKYDVKIHFEKDALKSLRFTGTLENETVEQVIHAIGIAAKINYQVEDRDIWFKEKSK